MNDDQRVRGQIRKLANVEHAIAEMTEVIDAGLVTDELTWLTCTELDGIEGDLVAASQHLWQALRRVRRLLADREATKEGPLA